MKTKDGCLKSPILRKNNWVSVVEKDVAFLMVITAISLWRVWPLVIGSKTVVTAGGDTGDFIYPFMVSAARTLSAGEFPLWTSELFGGQTLVGFPQVGALYPFNWLVWILGNSEGMISFHLYDWTIVVHILIAAWIEDRAHLKGSLVKKYRFLGLVLLVAIPLPGTGAWTGALAAAFLDMRLKDAMPSIFLGVLIAGGVIMMLTYGIFVS